MLHGGKLMNGIHETKLHGSRLFPYKVYRSRLPEYIHSYPLHWHEEMEVIYVTHGRVMITVRNQRCLAEAGDALIILPQDMHAIEQHEGEAAEYFNILFRLSLLDSGAGDIAYDRHIAPLAKRTRTLPVHLKAGTALCLNIVPHIEGLIASRRDADSELLIKSHLYALLHHLSRCSTDPSRTERTLASAYERLKPALERVHNAPAQTHSVEQAAALCGYSPSHFARLFREMTGASFAQYVRQYRLEMAADALHASDLPITRIALETGFHNLSYFTRAFAAQYGATPTQYRADTEKAAD